MSSVRPLSSAVESVSRRSRGPLLRSGVRRFIAASVMVAAASVGALATSAQAAPSGAPVVSSPSEPVAPIVGRWQQLHTCQELVDALNALGLGALAPGVVGDYFPDQTFDELAAKDDLCAGAKPQQHSHFFTADGLFGSLDQYGNQVDDDAYMIVDSNTIQIGPGTFDYSIQGGTLQLTPVITDKQRREALRNPEEFSTAGWMVAVSYPGTKWKNVPCGGWC